MADAADRHLLFGLIALQVGLIDQAQLVLAFRAWARDKTRDLDEHLVDRGELDADGRAAVDAMVALHLRKHGGDTARSLAAIPAGRSTRESLAAVGDPELTGTVAYLGSGSTDADSDSDARSDSTASYAVGTTTGEGQRFRVLRPHARGGLGAVFVAMDAELNREVALKQILDHHADDPGSRQRFLLEAEVTGGLEHPGIVPVYGLGTYGDGRPYYAMRFIKGDSLKEAIERFHAGEPIRGTGFQSVDDPDTARMAVPRTGRDAGRRSLELRQLLRRFTDVCNAIDYAHSRGVLHRDIKPGNIIVGKHGETLVVDWGLAKATGKGEAGADERTLVPASASGSAETLPGSAMGTPAYMSPEQARGDLESLGPRSDVYSLGATLYCLLTGRSPFEGEVFDILRRVQSGDFAPPRRVDPAVDAALEAVCLKAMAMSPEGRYPTPRALAEDVERWMADEPVSAWREPWRWRARRWLARHRSLVASAAAALLIVAVVSVGAALLIEGARRDEARALDARTRALAAEVRAKAEADRRLKDANQVVETFLAAVGDDLRRVQGAQAVRRRLLQQAADYFARVAAERSGDPELEYQAFRATYRSGKVRRMLSEIEEAIARYRDAARRGQDLLRAAPDSARYLQLLASTEIELGACMERLGRADEAEAAYRRSVELHGRALAIEPDDVETLNNLASAHNNLGVLLRGHPDRAEPEYRQAIELRRDLTRRKPEELKYHDDLGSSLTNLGMLEGARGRLREQVELQRESVAVRERAVKLSPDNPDYLRGLALSRGNLAGALGEFGRDEEAIRVYRVVDAEFSALVDRNPEVPEFRFLKAVCLIDACEVLNRLDRYEEALETSAAALREYEGLVRRKPESHEYLFGVGAARIARAAALDHLKRYAEAEPPARRARDEFEALVSRYPTVQMYSRFLGMAHLTLGQVLHHLGREAEAEAALRRAIEVLDHVARTWPDLLATGDDLAQVHESLAVMYQDQGRAGPFLQAVDAAMTHRRAAVERAPDSARPRAALAQVHRRRGEALLMLDRPDEAAGEADRLVGLRPDRADDLVDAARLLARAAGAVGGDRSETYAGRALERLRAARRIGPVRIAPRADDPGFAAIRSLPGFQGLLMDLAFPDEPFATGR